MTDNLSYFLELRVRLRGQPRATAIVDRCLQLIARAEDASPAEAAALDAEVEDLRAELLGLFGPPVRQPVN